MYNRYAESARVNWTLNFAASDPQHKAEWMELMTPKSVGLILRSIKTDYKFVSFRSIPVSPLQRGCSMQPRGCRSHESFRMGQERGRRLGS